MNWVAWKMLTGDRAKYFGTVFGVAFGVLLISQQMAIFVGLMRRTAHAAIDVRDAAIWVMDPEGKNVDEVKPLSDSDLYRVRGVDGVDWAVRLYKSLVRARIDNGEFRDDVPLRIVRDMIFGGAEHHTWAHLRDEGDFSPDAAADAITNMVYQGLERGGRSTAATVDTSVNRLERAVQRLEGLTGARRRKGQN